MIAGQSGIMPTGCPNPCDSYHATTKWKGQCTPNNKRNCRRCPAALQSRGDVLIQARDPPRIWRRSTPVPVPNSRQHTARYRVGLPSHVQFFTGCVHELNVPFSAAMGSCCLSKPHRLIHTAQFMQLSMGHLSCITFCISCTRHLGYILATNLLTSCPRTRGVSVTQTEPSCDAFVTVNLCI